MEPGGIIENVLSLHRGENSLLVAFMFDRLTFSEGKTFHWEISNQF